MTYSPHLGRPPHHLLLFQQRVCRRLRGLIRRRSATMSRLRVVFLTIFHSAHLTLPFRHTLLRCRTAFFRPTSVPRLCAVPSRMVCVRRASDTGRYALRIIASPLLSLLLLLALLACILHLVPHLKNSFATLPTASFCIPPKLSPPSQLVGTTGAHRQGLANVPWVGLVVQTAHEPALTPVPMPALVLAIQLCQAQKWSWGLPPGAQWALTLP